MRSAEEVSDCGELTRSTPSSIQDEERSPLSKEEKRVGSSNDVAGVAVGQDVEQSATAWIWALTERDRWLQAPICVGLSSMVARFLS